MSSKVSALTLAILVIMIYKISCDIERARASVLRMHGRMQMQQNFGITLPPEEKESDQKETPKCNPDRCMQNGCLKNLCGTQSLGKPCKQDRDCGYGNRCNDQGGCAKGISNSYSCKRHLECISEYCNNGKCEQGNGSSRNCRNKGHESCGIDAYCDNNRICKARKQSGFQCSSTRECNRQTYCKSKKCETRSNI